MRCPRCGGKLVDQAEGRVCLPCGILLPPRSAVAAEILAGTAEPDERLHLLETLPRELAEAERWDALEALLLAPSFLEAKVQTGMVFELAGDFGHALEWLSPGRPWRRVLGLLEEALLRDAHFIARYPATLFPCLWNSGWWYDCPEAAERYDPPEEGWQTEGAPWDREGPKLSPLLEAWRRTKEMADGDFVWLRSLRPPGVPLGGPQRVVIGVGLEGFRFLDLRFSADGRRLLAWLNPVGTADVSGRQLRGWDARTGQEAVCEEGEAPPHDPRISPDGRLRVEYGGEGGGWGQPLRLIEVATGEEVASLATDEDANIQSVSFSPGGERIIGGGWGEESTGEVMVWNVATGARLAWLRPYGSVFAVAVSFNRQFAATGSSEGEILLWDLDSGENVATLQGHEQGIKALAFSPDGWRIASASTDGTVRVWDLARIVPLPRLRDHPRGAGGIEFSVDGTRMLTSSGDDTAWLWDARSGAPVACLHASEAHYLEGGPPIPHVSIRGGRIFSLLRGAVWDADTGVEVKAGGERIWKLMLGGRKTVWSPDGNSVAGHGDEVTISSTADLHAEPLRLKGHTERITGAAFSPCSQLLVTGSWDRTVRVWDVAKGEEALCHRGHEQPVSCVAFSADGTFVASGGADGTVRVWEVTTEEEVGRIDIPDPGGWCSQWSQEGGRKDWHAIRAVAFTRDDRQVVTDCGKDFRLWDIASGALLRTFAGRASLTALAAGLPWQAFLRGRELVIERYPSGTEIARIPVELRDDPVAHPREPIWATGGRWVRHVALSGAGVGRMG